MLFIRKLNDSLRLYINYRGLNEVIIKNNYLLLLLLKTLERFAGTKHFTKINIRNTYYRIQVYKGDK
jgi:hypothetical protein